MSNMQPVVYVVTVCRNAAALLEPTMQSVLGQDYAGLRYVVVDGASTDDTLDVISRHASALYHWTSEPDGGIYDAMNKALDYVAGQGGGWVNFMNAGDAFADAGVVPDLFGRADIPDDVCVVGGDVISVYPDREEREPARGAAATPVDLPYCHQAAFVRIAGTAVGADGCAGRGVDLRFDLRYRIAADYDMFYRIYDTLGPGAFRTVRRDVARYRMDGSTSFAHARRMKAEYLAIQSRHRTWRWWKEWLKFCLHIVPRLTS